MNSEKSANSQQLPVTNEESPQEEDPQVSRLEPQALDTEPQVSQKTQGVRVSRSNGAQVLQDAAKKAARSNSRSDVAEYMRLRRGYV